MYIFDLVDYIYMYIYIYNVKHVSFYMTMCRHSNDTVVNRLNIPPKWRALFKYKYIESVNNLKWTAIATFLLQKIEFSGFLISSVLKTFRV